MIRGRKIIYYVILIKIGLGTKPATILGTLQRHQKKKRGRNKNDETHQLESAPVFAHTMMDQEQSRINHICKNISYIGQNVKHISDKIS